MINHANRVLQLIGRRDRVLDWRLEEEVDDVVAVVGDGRLVAIRLGARRRGAEAEFCLATLERRKPGYLPHRVLPTEGSDLNGQREARAEPVTQLRLVDDNDELFLRIPPPSSPEAAPLHRLSLS